MADTFRQLGDVIREITFQREWDQFRYGKPQSPWRPAKCPEDEGQFEVVARRRDAREGWGE